MFLLAMLPMALFAFHNTAFVVVNHEHCEEMYNSAFANKLVVIPNSCHPDRKRLNNLKINFRTWLVPDDETQISRRPNFCFTPLVHVFPDKCQFNNSAYSTHFVMSHDYLTRPLVPIYRYLGERYVGAKNNVPRRWIRLMTTVPASNFLKAIHVQVFPEEFTEYPIARNTMFHYIWSETRTNDTFPDSGITNMIDNSVKNICGVHANNTIIVWVASDALEAVDYFNNIKGRIRDNRNNIHYARNFIDYSPINIDDCNLTVKIIDIDKDDIGTPFEGKLRQFWDNHRGNLSFYAHFSDLYRTVVMYKYGGWYLDTDVIVQRPVMHTKALIAGERQGVINSPMYFPTPRHQILQDIALKIIANVDNYNTYDWYGFMIVPLLEVVSNQTDESNYLILMIYATLALWLPDIRFNYFANVFSTNLKDYFDNHKYAMTHWAGMISRYEHLCAPNQFNRAFFGSFLHQTYACLATQETANQ